MKKSIISRPLKRGKARESITSLQIAAYIFQDITISPLLDFSCDYDYNDRT